MAKAREESTLNEEMRMCGAMAVAELPRRLEDLVARTAGMSHQLRTAGGAHMTVVTARLKMALRATRMGVEAAEEILERLAAAVRVKLAMASGKLIRVMMMRM